jgi:hypothetical protein
MRIAAGRAVLCSIVASVIASSALLVRAQAGPDELPAPPPKDAIVLFDGKDLSQWEQKDAKDGSKEPRWKLVQGAMEVNGGDIQTKQKFKDFKLHVEFWLPQPPENSKGQARSNSGVYLQGRYEVQVLDSYGIEKPDFGDCGAVYHVKAPDVNACKPPQQWQTYDITFRSARGDGQKKTENARVTTIFNGQQIYKDVEIPGPTGQGDPEGPEAGPIRLQDHGHPVRYRNIWIVPMGEDAK